MNKRLVRIFMIFFIIISIIIVMIYFNNRKIIYKIGKRLSDLYSLNNIYYEEKSIKENDSSSIFKRFDKKIYYETKTKDGEDKIKYIDCDNEKYYEIQEENIAITDKNNYTINISENNYCFDIAKTKAENYCLGRYLNRQIGLNRIVNYKGIKTKEIENKKCYEITVNFSNGKEKTYFDKETLLPIKVIIEENKKIVSEKKIIIKENSVSEEEVIIPEKYKFMTWKEYLEYQKIK